MKNSKSKKRHWIQLIATVLLNGYAIGFAKGTIFTGKTKVLCVPILNCYSCPGALAACPIGALQSVLGDRNHNFSFYVLGFIMLFGILMGRLLCGFICPFGFFQDLLYKIKCKKIKIPKSIDKPMRLIKYFVLIVFVVILPIVLTNTYGMGNPYFCKWICPAGTLEGGIPLLTFNKALRGAIGFLFSWKIFLLLLVVTFSVFIYRPFCKYLCPLGAFYGLFNKFSFYQMKVEKEKCNGCKKCEKICKMNVEVTKNINSSECIRCGECRAACSQKAITVNPLFNKKTK